MVFEHALNNEARQRYERKPSRASDIFPFTLFEGSPKIEKKRQEKPSQEKPSGGRLKRRIIEKKKEELKDYTDDVKAVIAMYVPPDSQRMQQAYQAGNLSINPAPG